MNFRTSLALLTFLLTAQSVTGGGNCAGTGTGLTPLTELSGTYQGHQGYLYDGSNTRPKELTDQAPKIETINGKIVLASLGMSRLGGDQCGSGRPLRGSVLLSSSASFAAAASSSRRRCRARSSPAGASCNTFSSVIAS